MDEDQLDLYLQKHLTLEVEGGTSYGGENTRVVVLKLKGKKISQSSFNVKDSPDYEG